MTLSKLYCRAGWANIKSDGDNAIKVVASRAIECEANNSQANPYRAGSANKLKRTGNDRVTVKELLKKLLSGAPRTCIQPRLSKKYNGG